MQIEGHVQPVKSAPVKSKCTFCGVDTKYHVFHAGQKVYQCEPCFRANAWMLRAHEEADDQPLPANPNAKTL